MENDDAAELAPQRLGIAESYDCDAAPNHYDRIGRRPDYIGDMTDLYQDFCENFEYPNDDRVKGSVILKLLIKSDEKNGSR